MAIVTLAEVKTRLRIDTDDTTMDDELELLMLVARETIVNLTGVAFDETNPLAKIAALFIIQDLYDRRTMGASSGYKSDATSDKPRAVVDLILTQLSLCYKEGGEV